MTYEEKLTEFRAQYPDTEIEAGGGRFRLVMAGSQHRLTLVFLNGGMNLSEMWMDYLPVLSKKYRILLFDYPMEFRTNQALVKGIHALFQALKIEKPILIGASDGGMVAQIYVQKYPQWVGGLVLIATGAMDEATLRSLKRKYFASPLLLWYLRHCNYERLKPRLVKMGENLAKNESEADKRYVREMFEVLFRDYTREKDVHISTLLADVMRQTPVTREDFQALEGRILLILPTDDFFSKEMQENLTALMHHPRVSYVEGSHLSTILKADTYMRLMDAFFETEITA